MVLHKINFHSVVIFCLHAGMTEKELNGHPKAEISCLQAIQEYKNAGVHAQTSGDCGNFLHLICCLNANTPRLLQAFIFMNLFLQSAPVCR